MAMEGVRGHTTRLDRWLDGLRRGDVEARNEIIELACERLRTLARRMLRGYPGVRRWSETDDVLQGAMMRLHRSLAEVRPETARQFYGLAAAQIRRELIDLARHHNGPEGGGANHHTDGGGDAVGVEPDGRAGPQGRDDWTAFHEHAGRLPEGQRAVFGLLWYDGLTQPEAAAVLGVSLATLKRRWQEARISLFEAMRGEPPE
jgi:DNA-directed RNA polymerase specialized sigma24 family protein